MSWITYKCDTFEEFYNTAELIKKYENVSTYIMPDKDKISFIRNYYKAPPIYVLYSPAERRIDWTNHPITYPPDYIIRTPPKTKEDVMIETVFWILTECSGHSRNT